MSFFTDIPIEELQQSVQNNPAELDLWIALISRIAEEETSEAALEETLVAEEFFPNSLELRALKSLCLLSLGDTRAGYEMLNESIRRCPGDSLIDQILDQFLACFSDLTQDHLFNPYAIRDIVAPHLFERDFLNQIDSTIELVKTVNETDGDPEKLVAPLEDHVENFPEDINSRLDLARLCHNLGNSSQARKWYRSVIQMDPLCASAYFELATIEPDVNKAIELSEIGLDMFPRFECGRFNFAALLLQNGMLEEGRNEMLRLPADSPFYVFGLEAIANSYCEEGTFEKAIKFQEKVVALSPKNPESWNCFGHFFASLGKFETALTQFDQALKLDSEHIDALHNRALMLSELGRGEEAIHVLRYALAIDPEHDALLINLAVEMSNQQRLDEAINTLREALLIHPNHSRMWLNLGSFLCDAERYDESIEASERAIELVPDKAFAWWNIACAKSKLGDKEASLEALETAVRIAPELANEIESDAAFQPHLADERLRSILDQS